MEFLMRNSCCCRFCRCCSVVVGLVESFSFIASTMSEE